MGKKIDKSGREREVTIDEEVKMFLRSQGLSSSDELLELVPGELDAAVTASGLTLGARRQLRRELGLDPGGRDGAPREGCERAREDTTRSERVHDRRREGTAVAAD